MTTDATENHDAARRDGSGLERGVRPRIEYATEYVPRYYTQRGRELESPMHDTLEKRGANGWQLCAVGAPDSAGVVIYYFSRQAA